MAQSDNADKIVKAESAASADENDDLFVDCTAEGEAEGLAFQLFMGTANPPSAKK
jgi:hypothetical protein